MLDLLLPVPSTGGLGTTLAPLLLVTEEEEEPTSLDLEELDTISATGAVTGSEEVSIAMEEPGYGSEVEEEHDQPGREEPPPSPDEILEEEDEPVQEETRVGVCQGDVDEEEEDKLNKESDEQLQSKEGDDKEEEGEEEVAGEKKEDNEGSNKEGSGEEGGKEDEATEEGKEEKAEESSLDEATIRLARQLSQELTDSLSPMSVEEDRFSRVYQKAGAVQEEEEDIEDVILSAWVPSHWVQGVLASGRKVPPEQLTRPGLITLTGKVGDV